MKTSNQSVHLRSLNPAGSPASARNGQPRRRWRGLKASRLLVITGCLALAGSSPAQQAMSWSFYDGGSFGKSGSATNGTVTDSSSEIAGNGDTTLGTLNGTVSQSEVYIYHNGGPQTYGCNTTYGSTLHLRAYNKPGMTGTVLVTVTPYLAVRELSVPTMDTYSPAAGVTFTLQMFRNGNLVDKRAYDESLQGNNLNGGDYILTDNMAATTLAFADGDDVNFNLSHVAGASCNFWGFAEMSARAVAWYTVGVSDNGYLTINPRGYPVNPPAPILPPITPQTTSVAFTDGSHTQMTVSGVGGPTIAPLPYLVMTTTNLALPLANWLPCQTNNFAPDGTFAYSFPVTANEPQRFYQVRMTQ